MFTRNVQFWKEDGWQGRKAKVETWNADTKEDLFLRILTANNKIQKHFDKNKMNGDRSRSKRNTKNIWTILREKSFFIKTQAFLI